MEKLPLICFSLMIISGTQLKAAEPAARPDYKWITQWDNDLLSGTDQGYTNGVRLAVLKELSPDQETHSFLQKALFPLIGTESERLWGDQRRFRNDASVHFSWGTGITQLMYTPEDFRAPVAPDGERPYAGWLGLEFSLNVSDHNSVGSVTLSVGTTGENSFAEETQDWVHQNISNSPIFQGWDSQVPGELTVNLHVDRKETIEALDLTKDWPIEIDGYFEWGGALGNFRTNAYVGTLLRFGHNLTNNYATPRVQLGSYGHSLFSSTTDSDANFSLYGFTGIRATAVLHDITLDGPVFRDFDTGVDSRPLVGELLIGLGSKLGPVDLSLSQTFRSDEFYGQDENHSFGSILLQVGFRF